MYVYEGGGKMKTAILLIAMAALSGCATWHEAVSDFGDTWGEQIGLDVEPPIPDTNVDATVSNTTEAVESEPVTVEESTTESTTEIVQESPKLPAKLYPGTVTMSADGMVWMLANDPGGWDSLGGWKWNGVHWDGCAQAVVEGRNLAAHKAKVRWSKYDDHTLCDVVVFFDNSSGHPRVVWAMWPGEVK